jgi:hypothetical protein
MIIARGRPDAVHHSTLADFQLAVHSTGSSSGFHSLQDLTATLIDFAEQTPLYHKCPATMSNFATCGGRISDVQLTATSLVQYSCPLGHIVTMTGPAHELPLLYGTSAHFREEESGQVFRCFVTSVGLTSLLHLDQTAFSALSPARQIEERVRVQGKMVRLSIECDMTTQQRTWFVNKIQLIQ